MKYTAWMAKRSSRRSLQRLRTLGRAYSVQLFITTRAPWRSVIRVAGQRATAAR
jgi:hypothetical protein